MKIIINGEATDVAAGISVSELLKVQEVKMPDMVTVEHNSEIMDRDSFDSTTLKEEDKIEFLYFMGGGAIA